MIDEYIAHGREELKIIQSVSEHNRNVAFLAEKNCELEKMKAVAWVSGILHDAGKYQNTFQEYIKKAIKNEKSVTRGSVDHGTAGGQMINQMTPMSAFSEAVQVAIYCHHGLYDCFSLESGEVFISRRLKKKDESRFVPERFFQFIDKAELTKKIDEAEISFKEIMRDITEFIKNSCNSESENGVKKNPRMYGNRDFYLGMYERVLMSLLIDADRTDTANFMREDEFKQKKREESKEEIWDGCIEFFEEYLKGMKIKTKLDIYRKDISSKCKMAAKDPCRLYRLTVPTGAGKTLSSLRFALHHAKKYSKSRIIYIAPYNSILEQNAREIRKAIGNSKIVLEHHCNIIHESDEAREHYDALTENWESRIVVTTAVQLLNTLFSSKAGSIRRMHNLCNSIIIFDEIQALPIKIMKMFNLAVNFLTNFCRTTVVLCSATQPLLDKFPENRMLPPEEMTDEAWQYEEAFRRTTIIDKTRVTSTGFTVKELSEFVLEVFKEKKQILVIVNTRSCAKKLYCALKKKIEVESAGSCGCYDECKVFHLSNNMCVANRQEALSEIRASLDDEEPLICVSTALIEAGVDISFKSVIRSLTGLDSIIQAAGRCNRNGKDGNGNVYIVHIAKDVENISRLPDITKAQGIMQTVLNQFAAKPEAFDNTLASEKAIKLYYQLYLNRRMQEMDYPVSLSHGHSSLVELLSGNKEQWYSFHGNDCNHGRGPVLKQAFKTAGDMFEVISESGKIDVVVPYNKGAEKLIELLQNPYRAIEDKKSDIRKLQRYTVGISEHLAKSLDNAIVKVCDGTVLVLDKDYYNNKTGVEDTPISMENMFV